jgi:hypothetical protein
MEAPDPPDRGKTAERSGPQGIARRLAGLKDRQSFLDLAQAAGWAVHDNTWRTLEETVEAVAGGSPEN